MSEQLEAIILIRRLRFLKLSSLSQATTHINDLGCLE